MHGARTRSLQDAQTCGQHLLHDSSMKRFRTEFVTKAAAAQRVLLVVKLYIYVMLQHLTGINTMVCNYKEET